MPKLKMPQSLMMRNNNSDDNENNESVSRRRIEDNATAEYSSSVRAVWRYRNSIETARMQRQQRKRYMTFLCLLLLTAPLGSLWKFFFSSSFSTNANARTLEADALVKLLHEHEQQQKQKEGEGDGATESRRDLEKLIHSVLKEEDASLWYFPKDSSSTSFDAYLVYHNHKNSNLQTISILTPWLLSFLLGIVLPASLAIYNRFRPIVSPPNNQQQFISTLNPKQRHLSLIFSRIRHYQKTLTSDDFISFSHNTNYHEHHDQIAIPSPPSLSLCLPKPGIPLSSLDSQKQKLSNQTHVLSLKRIITNTTCAICLSPQNSIGDVLVWSSNPKCSHVFHQNCIVSWLLRQQQQQSSTKNNNMICPCCRQSFC